MISAAWIYSGKISLPASRKVADLTPLPAAL